MNMFLLCTRKKFSPRELERPAKQHLGNELVVFRSSSLFIALVFRPFIAGNMKFTVLEPDGKAHEFVLTGDKLGQQVLDKVRSTRNAEVANALR